MLGIGSRKCIPLFKDAWLILARVLQSAALCSQSNTMAKKLFSLSCVSYNYRDIFTMNNFKLLKVSIMTM